MKFLVFLILLPFIVPTKIPAEKSITEKEANWRRGAIKKLWDERKRMGHTPLIKYQPPGFPHTIIYMKNETATPTRNLKHRFAWALLLWAITEGKVTSRTSAIYEATSGNTGSAEAYMCRLVGVKYVAVVSDSLELEKVRQIEKFGGKVLKVPAKLRNEEAQKIAEKNHGFFMNQFANAEKAEEFHESGNARHESSNVFHEILVQLKRVPDYFIHAAGTGGTISSVGRYIVRYALSTRVILSDAQFSRFYDYVIRNKFSSSENNESDKHSGPGVAGTGYESKKDIVLGNTTSLVRDVISEAVKIPDIATAAGIRVLSEMGFEFGPSTALNFLVALVKAQQHEKRDPWKTQILTTLANDPADFYTSTYLNNTWLDRKFEEFGGFGGMKCWRAQIIKAINYGADFYKSGLKNCPGDY
ncbi:unnamed protein product [Caenorhabditis angaria]|uniref:Tryptophan synthase beta chain-like PALP domain-containing protein n=1 Tax=Caenorhabditis angaria TaxID=860376 RepID=A0A9P1IMD7_9PELO|nr:unnamed protein product [Caenorhabditis angaria]